MSEEESSSNAPTERQAAIIRVPDARYRADRVRNPVRPHTIHNTVAMPWVDFSADLAAIRAGRARRYGNRFSVHGREYVLEGNGRLYPTVGDGLYRLGRGGYRALAWYNDAGITEAVEAQLDAEQIREDERALARQVWLALRAWREDQG